jgi:hypothetical protein
MKALIKLTLTALIALSISSCDPWYWEQPSYSILQILQNNQPNTVYNKTMVTYSGFTPNGIIEFDTLYFEKTIKPGDTAQIEVKDLYQSRFYNVDTVMVHLELSNAQQWNQKFPRMYIRNHRQTQNNFIETIRF